MTDEQEAAFQHELLMMFEGDRLIDEAEDALDDPDPLDPRQLGAPDN